MNPAQALATVLVDELLRGGVTEAVLAPGSRSAPLAMALLEADRAGRLRLHVRIDERSAGFLAVGLARGCRRAVPVACTSGTATANLHPAVAEADRAGVPLLVLTADRPPALRAAAANQTIDQLGMYGTAVRMFHEIGVPVTAAGQNAYWRTLVCRAMAAAADGPVHLNLAFAGPLMPDTDRRWPESLDGRAGGAAWTRVAAAGAGQPVSIDGARQGVVVAAMPSRDAEAAAAALRWPLLVETGGAGSGGESLAPYGVWLLQTGLFAPQAAVCFGRPTLHRAVTALLSRPEVDVTVVERAPRWASPGDNVSRVAGAVNPLGPGERGWLRAWREADGRTGVAIADVLDAHPRAKISAARAVVAALPAGATLVLGSSQPIRDVGLATAARPDLTLYANRGAAGIDGTVSNAVGVALASGGPAYLLTGDLGFLHDSNGLIIGPEEPRPDLTVVLLDDDGGGIFAQLEPGEPRYADAFQRVFAAPTGVDFAALAAATGIPYERIDDPDAIAVALRPAGGLRIVHIPVDGSLSRILPGMVRDRVTSLF